MERDKYWERHRHEWWYKGEWHGQRQDHLKEKIKECGFGYDIIPDIVRVSLKDQHIFMDIVGEALALEKDVPEEVEKYYLECRNGHHLLEHHPSF